MGLAIEKDHFAPEEYTRFTRRLQQNLQALKALLTRADFGVGPPSLGAELELSIANDECLALPVNREALAASHDPHMQLELDRFNLEYNLEPLALHGRPFSALERQLEGAISALGQAVAPFGGRVAPIGILPTLRAEDLMSSAITDLPRYRALAAGIERLRGAPFEININGQEPLRTACNTVSLEGANTSFQIHLRANPEEFAATYNATQLVTPLVLALGANSPIFLSQILWDETRIALFKQAIDSRTPDRTEWRRAARVPFGHGWVRKSALELFAEAVALFPAIIPVMSDQDPLASLAGGDLPDLLELRLHQGTIWQWNRAIYDPTAGGHLRVEMRSLPSGPTPIDMAANAAFSIGLVAGLRSSVDDLLPAFPFHFAEYNFYRGAQAGLEAKLLWPSTSAPSPVVLEARELIAKMVPVAEEGLLSLEVDQSDIDKFLGVIRNRLANGITGARWQRLILQQLDEVYPRGEALAHMLELYLSEAESGRPVSEWRTQL